MRIRSPRTAPPVKGLLGSTAMTPTVWCRSRIPLPSASASVLLPVPGAPVNPTRYAFPVWGWPSATSWPACGSRSSARLMARASARTSPESKAPAKLISIRLWRGEGFEGEVGAEEDCDARTAGRRRDRSYRSEEHTSELQSPCNLVCRLLLEKKNNYLEKSIAFTHAFSTSQRLLTTWQSAKTCFIFILSITPYARNL